MNYSKIFPKTRVPVPTLSKTRDAKAPTGPPLEWVAIHPSILSSGWHPPVLKLDDLFLELNL